MTRYAPLLAATAPGKPHFADAAGPADHVADRRLGRDHGDEVEALDGNAADLEPDNDDEPWISIPEMGDSFSPGGDDDREIDGDEDEPSLGHRSGARTSGFRRQSRPRFQTGETGPASPKVCDMTGRSGSCDASTSQLSWSAGTMRDTEDDGDCREPDADGEAWLQALSLGLTE